MKSTFFEDTELIAETKVKDMTKIILIQYSAKETTLIQ